MPIDDKITGADSLVLGTWEAITLLGQAHERCNDADVAELLAEAEAILISVVLEMPALARSAGGPGRGNGFALFGEATEGVAPDQEPFDYRPRDRGLRNP
jgi:hypothetical protein